SPRSTVQTPTTISQASTSRRTTLYPSRRDRRMQQPAGALRERGALWYFRGVRSVPPVLEDPAAPLEERIVAARALGELDPRAAAPGPLAAAGRRRLVRGGRVRAVRRRAAADGGRMGTRGARRGRAPVARGRGVGPGARRCQGWAPAYAAGRLLSLGPEPARPA